MFFANTTFWNGFMILNFLLKWYVTVLSYVKVNEIKFTASRWRYSSQTALPVFFSSTVSRQSLFQDDCLSLCSILIADLHYALNLWRREIFI